MKFPIRHNFNNIIFLDVDGVLNHELFYEERYNKLTRHNNIPLYKVVKKHLRKLVKKKEIGRLEYYKSQIDCNKIEFLNSLCEETNSAVVLSSTWRSGKSVLDLNRMFQYCGATFTIVDKTGHSESRIRGVEIYEWLRENTEYWFDVKYYDFYRYAILDDDSDMLLWQQHNFFHVDRYAGLTPNHCYKIKRFFTHETF
jgi:hypothetical protein